MFFSLPEVFLEFIYIIAYFFTSKKLEILRNRHLNKHSAVALVFSFIADTFALPFAFAVIYL